MAIQILVILKMSECNSIETTNIHWNLCDQTKTGLNEISKVKDYFNSEIQERKIMCKKLSKYIAPFYYFDKTSLLYLWQVK